MSKVLPIRLSSYEWKLIGTTKPLRTRQVRERNILLFICLLRWWQPIIMRFTSLTRSALPSVERSYEFRWTQRTLLTVSEHQRYHGIGRMWWENFLNKSEIRLKTACRNVSCLEEGLNMARISWLGYALHIPTQRLPLYALIVEADVSLWHGKTFEKF